MAEKKLTKKTWNNINEMNLDSLKKELKDAEKKFFSLHMKHKTDELKQTHLLKNMRRYIAKIKTAISKQNTIKN